MKILMISKNVPTRYQGGIQTHVWKLSKYMIRQGHQVDILSAGGFKEKDKTYEVDGRTIHEIRYLPGRHIPIFNLLLEDLFFNNAAIRWIKKHGHQYDAVNVQGRSGFFYPRFNKRKRYPPSVTTFHGTAQGEYDANKAYTANKLERYLHKLFSTKHERDCLKFSDAVISVSDEMYQRISREFGKKLNPSKIIYNGIDLEDFIDVTESQDPNLLVFVGRLSAVKGIHILIKAFEKIPPPIKLVIVGTGPDEQQYKELVNQLNLGSQISFTGTLPFAEVRKWLQRCTVFVLPSFHESQGIVSMEANAFGKPVVASNIPGIDEVITDGVNGMLFTKGDSDDLAKKITIMFEEQEKAIAMGQEGKRVMKEKFDWEMITKQTLEVYKNVTAQN